MATDDRSPGLAVPDYSPFSGIRSYFTIARVSRDIFRQSSVGALYTDWECPTTGEFNRIGGVDTHLKFNPNWTLDGQARRQLQQPESELRSQPLSVQLRQSGQRQLLCRARPRSSNCAATACTSPTTELITTSAPGFVTIPGFINRVDIRETMQQADYRFRPKKGWIVDWGPSLVTALRL